jgi:UDP-GlcNAc:undecaprenyl-phosphate GlcNAc-1-phosphate transferase
MIPTVHITLLIFAPFLVSLVICLAIIPLLRILSVRFGWVAQPRDDRWGARSVPILGGAGIFVAFWAALLFSDIRRGGTVLSTWILLVCALAMFLLGLYDDAKKVKPPIKLIWQLAAATVVIFIGDTRIDFFPWPVANILLTYLWIVGITNAINLLDNMDGLAGGIAIIVSGMLAYFFWIEGQYYLLQIILALGGAILGFLIFNFPPARIFMGNNGSLFLGFLLAELAIARRTQASNVFAALGVPTLLMLLPILDTSFVMITRLLRGQSPIQGGADHTSHRLIAFGLSERQAVLTLYGVALLSGIAAAGLERLDYDLSLAFIPLLLIALALFTAHLGKVRVVPASGKNRATVERLVETLTYKRRLFEILLDLSIIGFSYYLAYWTRYGLNMTTTSMDLFMKSWPIIMGFAYLAFFLFGVYRGIWGYLGVNDLLRYGGATFSAGFAAWVLLIIIYPEKAFTADIFILFALFLLIGLAGSRASFQILDQFYSKQTARQGKSGVLIYGADDAGELVLMWILRNSDLGYKPIGFIDDKPQNWGRQIHNVKVIGDPKRIIRLIEQGIIKGVILSARSQTDTSHGSQLLTICREKGVWVRLLKQELEDI